jgi:hypothetical protein
VPRAHARVRDVAEHVAADARDGAAERATVGEHHADVHGFGRGVAAERAPRMARDLLDDRSDAIDYGQRQPAGRERPARDLGRDAGVERGAVEDAVEQPSPDAPALEAVELHRQRVGDVLAEVADRDAQPLPQERPHGVFGEADEVVECDDPRAARRERRGEERRHLVAIADERPCPVERDRVEAPRLLARERTGHEVPRIEGLERMAHDHSRLRRALGRTHGRVDDVEELADRDRGRPGDVRALVVARVRHDQPVRRREQRVEQQLPVLGAGIAVADVRVAEHEVVAVAGRPAGEHAVVHPEQADDPVRDRAHRHERADRQVAGPEVRARGTALEALGEQCSDLGGDELRPALGARDAGLGDDVVEDTVKLGALPGIAFARRGQGVGGVGERVGPGLDRLGGAEHVERRLQPVDELGEAAGEMDRAAVDVVEGQDALEQPVSLLCHRDPEQHPVQPRPPRPCRERVELERRSVRGVEPPADPAVRDPLL